MAPLSLRFAAFRRLGFRDGACHGDRLSAARMLEVMDDCIDCPFMDQYSPNEQAEQLDPLPCPVTLAWAQFDRLAPAATYGQTARDACPAPPGCSCPMSDTLRWSTPPAWWPEPSWP
jgi:hypothetical protein